MQKIVNWALVIVIIVAGIFAVRYVTRPIEAEAHHQQVQPNRPCRPRCRPRPPRPWVPRPPATPITFDSPSSSSKSMRRRWDIVMMFKALKAKEAQELSTAAVDTTEQ